MSNKIVCSCISCQQDSRWWLVESYYHNCAVWLYLLGSGGIAGCCGRDIRGRLPFRPPWGATLQAMGEGDMSGCRQPDDSFATLTQPATESSRSLDASAYPGLRESFAHAFPTLLGNNVEIVSSSPEVKDSLEADLAAEIQATQREEEAAIPAVRTLPPTWQHVSTE